MIEADFLQNNAAEYLFISVMIETSECSGSNFSIYLKI